MRAGLNCEKATYIASGAREGATLGSGGSTVKSEHLEVWRWRRVVVWVLEWYEEEKGTQSRVEGVGYTTIRLGGPCSLFGFVPEVLGAKITWSRHKRHSLWLVPGKRPDLISRPML